MGIILQKYYTFANEKGGISLRAKLAMKTCITTNIALELPDSPENLEKVKKALKELLPGDSIPDYS